MAFLSISAQRPREGALPISTTVLVSCHGSFGNEHREISSYFSGIVQGPQSPDHRPVRLRSLAGSSAGLLLAFSHGGMNLISTTRAPHRLRG
jgi:hypothetical protein